MKKAILVSLTALAVIGGTLAITTAYADFKDKRGYPRNGIMREIIEKEDYNRWREFYHGRGLRDRIKNEEDFKKFVLMHKLMWEGRYEEADKIREELGMGDCISRYADEGLRYRKGWGRYWGRYR